MGMELALLKAMTFKFWKRKPKYKSILGYFPRHPLPNVRYTYKDYKNKSWRYRVYTWISAIDHSDYYQTIDRLLDWSPRAWKRRKISRFHRFV